MTKIIIQFRVQIQSGGINSGYSHDRSWGNTRVSSPWHDRLEVRTVRCRCPVWTMRWHPVWNSVGVGSLSVGCLSACRIESHRRPGRKPQTVNPRELPPRIASRRVSPTFRFGTRKDAKAEALTLLPAGYTWTRAELRPSISIGGRAAVAVRNIEHHRIRWDTQTEVAALPVLAGDGGRAASGGEGVAHPEDDHRVRDRHGRAAVAPGERAAGPGGGRTTGGGRWHGEAAGDVRVRQAGRQRQALTCRRAVTMAGIH